MGPPAWGSGLTEPLNAETGGLFGGGLFSREPGTSLCGEVFHKDGEQSSGEWEGELTNPQLSTSCSDHFDTLPLMVWEAERQELIKLRGSASIWGRRSARAWTEGEL